MSVVRGRFERALKAAGFQCDWPADRDPDHNKWWPQINIDGYSVWVSLGDGTVRVLSSDGVTASDFPISKRGFSRRVWHARMIKTFIVNDHERWIALTAMRHASEERERLQIEQRMRDREATTLLSKIIDESGTEGVKVVDVHSGVTTIQIDQVDVAVLRRLLRALKEDNQDQ